MELYNGSCVCYLDQDVFVFVLDVSERFLVLFPQVEVLQRRKN